MTETLNSYNKAVKQFTLADKQAICEAWTKTGLSKSAFIRNNNLPWSFFTWCNKLLPNSNDKINKSFVQVITKDKNSILSVPMQPINNIEIKIICNAMTINLSLPKIELINLLKELSNGTAIIRQ
jgi:ACT domain-containing protein